MGGGGGKTGDTGVWLAGCLVGKRGRWCPVKKLVLLWEGEAGGGHMLVCVFFAFVFWGRGFVYDDDQSIL